MVDIRYEQLVAHIEHGNTERPSDVIDRLGIKYKRWESHPIADQIILRDCSDVPEDLPEWITIIGEPISG